MNTAVLSIDYEDKKTHHKFHLPISVFKKPTNEKEYANLEKILNKLIETVRDNEKHPLALVMQIIGDNLESYDDDHHPEIGLNVSEVDMVKYLMQSRGLKQSDLSEIFSGQSNVSRYLNGERTLSKRQIAGLKRKLGISADFFVR